MHIELRCFFSPMTDDDGNLLCSWVVCLETRISIIVHHHCSISTTRQDAYCLPSRGVYSTEAWTQPASLKKRGGNENHAYFRQNWGERKIKGEERLNYLSTYLHCLPIIFSKILRPKRPKSVCGWGSAYDAPPDLLVGWAYDKIPPCTHWTVTSHLMSAAE